MFPINNPTINLSWADCYHAVQNEIKNSGLESEVKQIENISQLVITLPPEPFSIIITSPASKKSKHTLRFQKFTPSSLSKDKMILNISHNQFIDTFKKYYGLIGRKLHPNVPKIAVPQILNKIYSGKKEEMVLCACQKCLLSMPEIMSLTAKEIWRTYKDECSQQATNQKQKKQKNSDALPDRSDATLDTKSDTIKPSTENQKQTPEREHQIRTALDSATKLNYKKVFNNNKNRIALAEKLKQNNIVYEDFIEFLRANNDYRIEHLPIPHAFILQAMENLVHGNPNDIDILFKRGLSPNTQFVCIEGRNEIKRSLLYYAVLKRSEIGVQIILAAGANPYYIPDSDEFEISYAGYFLKHNMPKLRKMFLDHQNILAKQDNLEVSEYKEHDYKPKDLLQYEAKSESPFKHVFFKSMVTLDIAGIKKSIETGKGNIIFKYCTILDQINTFRLPAKIFIAFAVHPDFKKALHQVQTQAKEVTSIFSAVQYDAYWLVRLHLRYGVPANNKTTNGATALHFATNYRAHRSMEVLMQNGANPHIQTIASAELPAESALDIARNDKDLQTGPESVRILTARYLAVDIESYRQKMQALLGTVTLTITPQKTFLIQLCDEPMNCHLRRVPIDEGKKNVSEEKLGQSDNTATYRMSFRETTASKFTSYASADEVGIKLAQKQFIKQFIHVLPNIDSALAFQVTVDADKYQLEIPAGGYEYDTFPMEQLFNSLAQTIWETSIKDKGKEICDRLGSALSMFGQFTFNIDRDNNLQLHFPVGSPIKCSVNKEAITIEGEEFYKFLNACFYTQITKVINTPLRPDSSENYIVLTLPVVNDSQFSLEEIVKSIKAKLLEHHETEQARNRKPEVLKVPEFTKQQRIEMKLQEEKELRLKKEAEDAEKKRMEEERIKQYTLTPTEHEEYASVATMETHAITAATAHTKTKKIEEHKKTRAAELEAKKQIDADKQKGTTAIDSKATQPQKIISRMNRLNEVFALAIKIGVAIALHHTSPFNEPESKLDITPEKQFKAALSLQCYLQKLVCQLIEIQTGLGLDVAKLKKLFKFRTSAGHMLNHLDKTTIFDGIKEIVKVLMDQYTPDKLKQKDFVVREFSAIATLFDFTTAGMDPNSYNPIFDLAKTSLYRAAETYYTDLQNDNFFTDIKSEPIAKPMSKPIQEGLLSSDEKESLLKETPNFLANVQEKWIPLINRLWLKIDDAPRQIPKTVFYSAPLPTVPRQSYELNDDLIDVPAATTLLSIIGELYPRLRRDQVNGMADINNEFKEFLLRCKIIRNALCHWGGDGAQHGIENNGIMYKTIYKKDEDTQEVSCWVQFGRFRGEARSFVGQPQATKFDDFVVQTCELGKKINSNKLTANAPLDTSYQRLVSSSVSADEMTSTEIFISANNAPPSSASSVISNSMMDTRSSSALITPFVALVNNNQRPSLSADASPFVPAGNSGPTATNSPNVTSTTEQLKM